MNGRSPSECMDVHVHEHSPAKSPPRSPKKSDRLSPKRSPLPGGHAGSAIFPSGDENDENDSSLFNQPRTIDFGFGGAMYRLARSDSFRDDMDPTYHNLTVAANSAPASKHELAMRCGNSETPLKKRKEGPSQYRATGDNSSGDNTDGETTGMEQTYHPDDSRLNADFVLTSYIGTGTFGTVMHVTNKMSGVDYAVKKSRRPFACKSERESMLKEVATMAELSAASDDSDMTHIVRYYCGWIEDEHVYLQMELCEISVEAMLCNHAVKLQAKEIARILRHVCLGLKFIHGHDLVHLDIKPGNILKKNSQYKITDFGLALHTQGGKASKSGSVEEGDSRYLAREMLDWAPVEDLTRCDMFSVGMTAYELVSGMPVPAQGDQWQQLRSDHWPAPVNANPEMCEILSALLKKDPKVRPTAEECLHRYASLMSDDEKEIHFQKMQIQSLTKELLEERQKPPRLRRHHSCF